MKPTILGMVTDTLRDLVDSFTTTIPEGVNHTMALERSEWDLEGLAVELAKIMPLPRGERFENWRQFTAPELTEHLVKLAEQTYEEKETVLTAPVMRQLERLLMLRAVDNRWVRHLTDLDELREGIGLRAFAQQDPLVAYKKEAHEMYDELLAHISDDVVHSIYHAQIVARPAAPVRQMQTNRSDGGGQPQPVRSAKTLGRNDPCWCGSGKKYKNCHMRSDEGREPAPATAGAQPQAARPPAAQAPARQPAGKQPPAKGKSGR
jgi:preprotein translocase subunit SecA